MTWLLIPLQFYACSVLTLLPIPFFVYQLLGTRSCYPCCGGTSDSESDDIPRIPARKGGAPALLCSAWGVEQGSKFDGWGTYCFLRSFIRLTLLKLHLRCSVDFHCGHLPAMGRRDFESVGLSLLKKGAPKARDQLIVCVYNQSVISMHCILVCIHILGILWLHSPCQLFVLTILLLYWNQNIELNEAYHVYCMCTSELGC